MKHGINTIVLIFTNKNEYYFAVICIGILFQSHNLHCRFGGDLSQGQAQNGLALDLSTLKTIGILTKVFCISSQFDGWIVDGRSYRRTDAGNDNTQRPKLPSGKMTSQHTLKIQGHCFGFWTLKIGALVADKYLAQDWGPNDPFVRS